MPLRQHVYSALILSSSDRFDEQILQLLDRSVFSPVCFEKSVGGAQRRTAERSFDIVLINSPLPDDFGARFAIDISAKNTTVVMMFVKSEVYGGVYDKVSDYGVFTLKKPMSSQSVIQALDFLKATRERLRRMEKKSLSLQDKMEEIKIVNHAKWVLIKALNMNEEDAHKYIEKQAMDRCVSKREIAESIISTYK